MTLGISEMFNANVPEGAGPRNYACFVYSADNPDTPFGSDINMIRLSTLMHDRSHGLRGTDSLTQNLTIMMDSETGEVTNFAVGRFNLTADSPVTALQGGRTYTYSSVGEPFMQRNHQTGEAEYEGTVDF